MYYNNWNQLSTSFIVISYSTKQIFHCWRNIFLNITSLNSRIQLHQSANIYWDTSINIFTDKCQIDSWLSDHINSHSHFINTLLNYIHWLFISSQLPKRLGFHTFNLQLNKIIDNKSQFQFDHLLWSCVKSIFWRPLTTGELFRIMT